MRAGTTTRRHGVSQAPYDSLNLADHVGDQAAHVLRNREILKTALRLPSEPSWLAQQHTVKALRWPNTAVEESPPIADAVWTDQPGVVLTVMTADCLPVLLTNHSETLVAAVHAGWRGLADGILQRTIEQLPESPNRLKAWIGPAISQKYFEVGPEVLDAFVEQRPASIHCFSQTDRRTGKYHADLPRLAELMLKEQGVEEVTLSGLCSYADAERFYSYRRDGQTGRMASLIWLDA